jgi:hypothetical protein
MTGKRSRLITTAAAGTLVLAAGASAAAATLPAGSAVPRASTAYAHLAVAGQQDTWSAGQSLVHFDRVRFSLGQRQYAYEIALQKAAAKAAAAREAAARAAAAKAAAEQAQQGAAQQVVQQAAVTTASGSPQQIAQSMLGQFGWSASQFSCLDPLWAQESGWSVTAQNAGSGAYGIPQALPGSKMASAGADWQTDAATQIRWGLEYIQGTYGSPCAAWSHEQADGWY